MPLVIGVTGSIATGKSLVCQTLVDLGAVHCDADRLVDRMYDPGPETFDLIVGIFGTGLRVHANLSSSGRLMALADKVVVITGASRGIGRALAVGFAKERAKVVASARTLRAGSGTAEGSLEDTVRQIADGGGHAIAIACDVADEEQVDTLVRRTLAEVGPIDVVINNAGVNPTGFITEFAVADFDRALAVNVRGPFLVCKYVAPGMMERRQGNIINISSRSAIWDTPNSLIYGASKAALDRFTLNLAVDLKPYNIAVNALGPGLVASEMTRDHDPSQDIWGRTPDPPEVMVPPATWLAQQDASSFTGRVVHRDEFRKTWP